MDIPFRNPLLKISFLLSIHDLRLRAEHEAILLKGLGDMGPRLSNASAILTL